MPRARRPQVDTRRRRRGGGARLRWAGFSPRRKHGSLIATRLLLGPVIGGLLLLGTTAAFNVVNVIAGLVYVVTLPYVAIATTYMYYDLKTRSELAVRRPAIRELPAEI